jgi:hypothetical protein
MAEQRDGLIIFLRNCIGLYTVPSRFSGITGLVVKENTKHRHLWPGMNVRIPVQSVNKH